MVEDVSRTVDFYRDVLGFEVVMAGPRRRPLQWALLKRGETELMFQARHGLHEALPGLPPAAGPHAVTFYIGVPDVEAFFAQVQARVQVVRPLHDTPYGTREFSIEDCNGFVLTFAEGGHTALASAA